MSLKVKNGEQNDFVSVALTLNSNNLSQIYPQFYVTLEYLKAKIVTHVQIY